MNTFSKLSKEEQSLFRPDRRRRRPSKVALKRLSEKKKMEEEKINDDQVIWDRICELPGLRPNTPCSGLTSSDPEESDGGSDVSDSDAESFSKTSSDILAEEDKAIQHLRPDTPCSESEESDNDSCLSETDCEDSEDDGFSSEILTEEEEVNQDDPARPNTPSAGLRSIDAEDYDPDFISSPSNMEPNMFIKFSREIKKADYLLSDEEDSVKMCDYVKGDEEVEESQYEAQKSEEGGTRPDKDEYDHDALKLGISKLPGLRPDTPCSPCSTASSSGVGTLTISENCSSCYEESAAVSTISLSSDSDDYDGDSTYTSTTESRPSSPPNSVIMYQGRNLLDLQTNMTYQWNFQMAAVPQPNIPSFFEHRSVFHRLGPYGYLNELGRERCPYCPFEFVVPKY